MNYRTTITSKGTITIASPIRKALGLRPGQKVEQFVDEHNRVVLEPGVTMEEFIKFRDKILRKYPQTRKRLTKKEVEEAVVSAKKAQYKR